MRTLDEDPTLGRTASISLGLRHSRGGRVLICADFGNGQKIPALANASLLHRLGMVEPEPWDRQPI